ncbi:hypothetical protein [Tsukamurella tyrosinosolvens]|nr:hypothetical protein [Tsukamurella tyrosinosolvens]
MTINELPLDWRFGRGVKRNLRVDGAVAAAADREFSQLASVEATGVDMS